MTVDDLTALRARREGVARAVATLTFDLGGLAAEMANAGQFRLDVLTRHAAELRAADAELTELDRQLAAATQHVAGSCSRCAAQNAPDAAFCSRCGGALGAVASSAAA